MALVIAEKLNGQINLIKATQEGAVSTYEKFVENLQEIYFNPATAPTSAAQNMVRLQNQVEACISYLEKFMTLGFDLADYINSVYDRTERATDIFFAWSGRKVVSVKEACEIHGKSRSTIYRWIKQGKLQAVKEGRKWVIAA